MENSSKSNSNKNSDSKSKSPIKNNSSQNKYFPQFSIISSSKRKTYTGSEHPSKRWGHSAVLYNNSMIIFGGRHSQRILSNIYSLDFATLSWSKIEPYSKTPQARDSHSAIIYKNNDMIIFGGNGVSGKMNDLWNFNFNLKKWTEITNSGNGLWPKARDGHNTAVIYDKYMVIYAGLDDKDNVIQDIFLYEIEKKIWNQCEIQGCPIQDKDGQSCCKIGDVLYLFGGQGPKDDEYSNDLFMVKFDIPENIKEQKPKAIIEKVEVNKNSLKPNVRASQTCVGYKDQYLIIIGGESKTQEPLDDIWLFDLKLKTYSEIKLESEEKIEGRFCHTCLVNGDFVAIYGGMQNSETTLDNLTILSIESKNKKNSNNNIKTIKNKKVEILSNNKKKKLENNESENKNDTELNASGDILSDNNINNNLIDMEDFAGDTNDLNEINFYSFEELKKNYLNNLMTWKFLLSLSDFYKWPLGCIGNFIQNSCKPNLNTKNIHIDINKFRNDEIYLSIKDDGKGMSCSEFNGVLFSFVKNQNKELNYFQYGFSMKTSALRLANSFLIISKTLKEISIGMISAELQKKLIEDKNSCEYILTPIVNYKIENNEKNEIKNKYIPKSNFPLESINLILEQINFLFKDNETLIEYFDSFNTGTHIYLFDLRTKNKNESGYLKTMKENNSLNNKIISNYELLFDEEENDIYLNDPPYFPEDFKKNIIDFSLKTYLKFLFLKPDKNINIYLFQKKLDIENPYYNIKSLVNDGENVTKITNLKYNSDKEKEIIDCFDIEGTEYKGILFNEKFIDGINNNTNAFIEEIKEKNYFNGVLLYKDNILINRLNQLSFGDINFFIKKSMNINNEDEIDFKINKNIFKRNGYIELPNNCYELQFNNMEFKDQALLGFIHYKIKMLLEKIQKN